MNENGRALKHRNNRNYNKRNIHRNFINITFGEREIELGLIAHSVRLSLEHNECSINRVAGMATIILDFW